MKFIDQYKNLGREIYILFFGRIVTSMGALIWPLMTLILKNKMGYDATFIAHTYYGDVHTAVSHAASWRETC